MGNPEQYVDRNDEQPEITSLDPSPKGDGCVAGSARRLRQIRQTIRNNPPLRAASIGSIFLLCLLVLFLLIRPYFPFAGGHVSQPSNSSSTSSLRSSALINAVMDDGIVYINLPDGTLSAYRAIDGKLLWHRQSGASGILVATAQALYRFEEITTTYGDIEAFRASDGSLLWRQQVPPGGGSPLIVQDGIIYFGSQEGVVYALRANDGRVLWHFKAGFAASSVENIISVSEGIASISAEDGMVYVLRASDGSLIYHYPEPLNSWAPIVDNGMIYIDLSFGWVQARSASDGSLVWQYRAQGDGLWPAIEEGGVVYLSLPGGSVEALRARDGALLWQSQTIAVINPPVIYNQLAYLAFQDGEIMAVQADDGRQVWSWRPSTTSEADATALVVSGGIVYINLGAPGSTVSALQADTGQVLWHHTLPATGPGAPPAASNGILYLGPDANTIEAWRGSDGHFLWRFTSPAALEWNPQPANGILLIWSLNGTIDLLRISDGKLLWRYPQG
jgi:outer membrane protein assembly factor BamB